MEKQILKIIAKNNLLSTPFSGNELAAKEIADHVFEFMEWCIINTYKIYESNWYEVCDIDQTFKMYESNWYGVCDIDQTFATLDELYTYWKDNVLK
jgi:hypothetical protein